MADSPETQPTPLSASRLRAAFARMLGKPSDDGAASETESPSPRDEAVTPAGIVEALLFVGQPDGLGRSAEALAATIRDTTPAEVEAHIHQLNDSYEASGAAYRIERIESGHRLALADGLERVGDRLRGKVRAAQLSPASLEVLSVVAYRQPIDAEEVEQLCGSGAPGSLRQLNRLGLIQPLESGEGEVTPPTRAERFTTTDRFLRTLGLASLDQLPRVAELDD